MVESGIRILMTAIKLTKISIICLELVVGEAREHARFPVPEPSLLTVYEGVECKPNSPQAHRIVEVTRIAANVLIRIHPVRVSCRVLLHPPHQLRRILPVAEQH